MCGCVGGPICELVNVCLSSGLMLLGRGEGGGEERRAAQLGT